MPVLYVVACGGRPAADLPAFVAAAQDDGWVVCVVATPDGLKFLDAAALEAQTGYPVRSRYKQPDEPDVLPPADAFVVAPATFNTVNKLAAGISDTLALGLLNEGIGLGRPVIVVPTPNVGLSNHPAFQAGLRTLRSWGVTVLFDPASVPPLDSDTTTPPPPFPWPALTDALHALPPMSRGDRAVLTGDGCRLWTRAGGDGPVLVFVHGGPGLWDMAGDLATMFAGHYRTVRWDQRGCGRSQRRGPYTLDRSIADLGTVLDAHADGPATLLGHSWGAHLALEFTLRHPERVRRLVYVAGTGIDDEDTWKPAFRERTRGTPGGLDRESVVRQWTAEFPDRARAAAHAEAMATPWFDINGECNATLNAEIARRLRETDLAARCRGLRVPVLIVDGSEDLRPRWAVDSLAAALPEVRRVVLEGASHLPWVEDPDGFSGAVLGDPRR